MTNAMMKMKLSKLPDRVPVKMQIALSPELAARLRDYADFYAATYGVQEEPADLVPFMLQALLDSDSAFRRASRSKTEPEDRRSETGSDAARGGIVDPKQARRETQTFDRTPAARPSSSDS
jgi:hypothetical protein